MLQIYVIIYIGMLHKIKDVQKGLPAMKKWILTLTLLLLLPVQAFAANPTDDHLSFPDDFRIDTQIVNLPNNQSVLADMANNRIELVDLNTSKSIWKKSYERIFSYDVLTSSSKLVLLVEHKQSLQKITLSTATGTLGKVLSTVTLPAHLYQAISGNGSQLAWSAPTSTSKEQIVVQSSKQLSVYQAPWTKAVLSTTPNIQQTFNYESANPSQVKTFSHYVVAQYHGGSLMQTQIVFYIWDIAHTTVKGKTITIPWNIDADFQLQNNELVLYTTNIKGNALGANTDKPFPIYARYNLATGQPTYEMIRTLADRDAEWTTDYNNNQVFLIDDNEQKNYLYDRNGKEIWQMSKTSDNTVSKFIKYENGLLYMIVENLDHQFSIVKQPLL